MSTLRVDNIKSRTGTTVTIPDSNNLSVSGSLTVTGVSTYSSGAQLNLQGTNINSGTRGDVLYYDSNGKIAKLTIGAAGSVLKSDGSDVVWGGIGGATNVYYVATSGTDSVGRGGSIDTAWRSLKYACSNIGTPTATAPAVIFVKAGVYEEGQLPIIVPPYTTIVGDNLRATIIKPASGLDSGGSTLNTRSTLFRCSNGTIIQDLVCDGMGGYTPGSPGSDPTAATLGGVYFALNGASVITDKSPYIYNVTTFGDGATGAVVDGSVHASGNRSMLFHTVTHIHSDGLGCWAKDNANAEIISGFTYYCQIGFTATGGSKIRSLNSSNSYGEYGVFSKGYDTSETSNDGTVKGTMLSYQGTISGSFVNGELITGAGGATAYIVSAQSEPKVLYIVQKTGTFQSGEVVTGAGGATATLVAGTVESNQSGRILVTTFGTAPDAGDSLQFATTDGNAYQIQSVSNVTANGSQYRVLVFSGSRATPVASNTIVNVRKEFSQVRLTGHDFLNVGTGGTDTTKWPNSPSQQKQQQNQVVTLATDPGRVYYVATDEDGNFYVGDQFKVEQATGQVTLDSSAFDLTGLESLQLGSIGGLIGASVNEFSTDITMSQNSNNKVPTQAAVRGYIESADHTFNGNVTFNGTSTTIDSVNVIVEDKNIGIGSTSSPSNTTADGAGLTIFGGSDGDKTFTWERDTGCFEFSEPTKFKGVVETISVGATYNNGSGVQVLELDLKLGSTFTHTANGGDVGIVSFKNMPADSGLANGATVTVIHTQAASGPSVANTTGDAGFSTINITPYEDGSTLDLITGTARAGSGTTITASSTLNDVDFISFFVQYTGGNNAQNGSYSVYCTKNGSFR